MRYNICWITPDYFADCDIPLVPLVAKKYDIHWIILFQAEDNRYNEEDFKKIVRGHDNVTLEFVYKKRHRLAMFNPLLLAEVINLKNSIKLCNPYVIYINAQCSSLFFLPLAWILPKSKTIYAAHQGIVRKDMAHARLTQFVRDLWFSHVRYVNMFSESEASKFHARYPKVTITTIPLALKDFGEPTNVRPSKEMARFLSFGLMVYAKHVDLLIDAANILYEKGYRNFKIVIKGAGSDWERCKQHVKYSEVIEADIRRIDNNEIPNLFNGCHYLVQPYRAVSQSGPMKIAFRYNLPDIVSSLPGLTNELERNINGYVFKTEDVNDLARVMERCINQSLSEYNGLLQRMAEYTSQTYSKNAIAKQYDAMFNKILRDK